MCKAHKTVASGDCGSVGANKKESLTKDRREVDTTCQMPLRSTMDKDMLRVSARSDLTKKRWAIALLTQCTSEESQQRASVGGAAMAVAVA